MATPFAKPWLAVILNKNGMTPPITILRQHLGDQKRGDVFEQTGVRASHTLIMLSLLSRQHNLLTLLIEWHRLQCPACSAKRLRDGDTKQLRGPDLVIQVGRLAAVSSIHSGRA